MRNTIALAALVVGSFVGLAAAPSAAQAEPICAHVWFTGMVNYDPGGVCEPYPLGTTCDDGTETLLTLVVHDHVCVPSIL